MNHNKNKALDDLYNHRSKEPIKNFHAEGIDARAAQKSSLLKTKDAQDYLISKPTPINLPEPPPIKNIIPKPTHVIIPDAPHQKPIGKDQYI